MADDRPAADMAIQMGEGREDEDTAALLSTTAKD